MSSKGFHWKLSEETKAKMRKPKSEIACKHSSESHKGQVPWIKGKHHSEETISKMRKPKSEETRSKMRGRHPSEETLAKLRKPKSEEHCRHISEAREGKSSGMLGKHHSEETLAKMSGENCHLWKGGISFEPYGSEFNETLKEQIRSRDNFVCHICGRHQGKRKFPVHHIDYNKKNNDPSNLVTLCFNCHPKTNGRREQWIAYFMQFPLFTLIISNPLVNLIISKECTNEYV
jgi:hypothetical protein